MQRFTGPQQDGHPASQCAVQRLPLKLLEDCGATMTKTCDLATLQTWHVYSSILTQCSLQVPNEMGTQYHDVLSAQDVAVYGGLCALASFDRCELRHHVINNVSFRDYMEVNPEVMTLLVAACLCGQHHMLHWVLSLRNSFFACSDSP